MPTFGVGGDQGPRGAGWVDPDVVRENIARKQAIRTERARKEPGLIGRHLHLAVTWFVAIQLGLLTGLWVVVHGAMASELMHQHDHAVVKHEKNPDWRNKDNTFLIAGLLLLLTPCHWIYLPTGKFWWQMLCMLIYVVGQVTAGAVWHRLVHKRKVSSSRIQKSVVRGVVGLVLMALGVRMAI